MHTQMDLHILLLFFVHCSSSAADVTSFIHKDCANQSFQDPVASQNLQSLFKTLVSQSCTSKFYKTTAGGNNHSTTSITGFYRCSGDLSNTECHTCVKNLPNTSQNVCNPNNVAAQVYLRGCYIKYMALGWDLQPRPIIKCGSRISGFEERVEAALSQLTKEVANGDGFYLGEYQSFFLVAQCDVYVRREDCVKCVKSAVEISKRKCKSSISSSISIGPRRRCFIHYNYTGYVGDVGGWGRGRGENPKDVAFLLGGMAVTLLFVF